MAPPKAFRPDLKLTDVLAQGRFTLSAEVIPPRNGAEQGKVLAQIDTLVQAGAQFIAVTKGAGGSLRGGSLPIAQAIKESFGVPCIAHFTCRDILPEEIENQLMDHHYFGIRNILALRGDPPEGQPQWRARDGGYSYAYQLMNQIRDLNQGKYLQRTGGPPVGHQEATDFCFGAAVYPEHPNEEEKLLFFQKKVEAGAQFAVTNMLFDPESYGNFLDLCATARIYIPILPGTLLLKSKKQAQALMSRFKVPIPAEFLKKLPESENADSLAIGIEIFQQLVDKLQQVGAPGIHVFVIMDTAGSAAALKQLSREEQKRKV